MVIVVLVAGDLGFVVVERDVNAGDVREIRRDVVACDFDLAVLHVFGMHEENVVDHFHVFEKYGTNEAIKIAASDEAVLVHGGCSKTSISRSLDRVGPDLRMLEGSTHQTRTT